ncbi:hypothetical protein Tco_0728468 [Tanacetum coccineum]|uniref:Uncharacterized protein n=1 Tax=Tanacetum coccineum TaxID=301880 RepID=A0ABQ4YM27_9ASTR
MGKTRSLHENNRIFSIDPASSDLAKDGETLVDEGQNCEQNESTSHPEILGHTKHWHNMGDGRRPSKALSPRVKPVDEQCLSHTYKLVRIAIIRWVIFKPWLKAQSDTRLETRRVTSDLSIDLCKRPLQKWVPRSLLRLATGAPKS